MVKLKRIALQASYNVGTYIIRIRLKCRILLLEDFSISYPYQKLWPITASLFRQFIPFGQPYYETTFLYRKHVHLPCLPTGSVTWLTIWLKKYQVLSCFSWITSLICFYTFLNLFILIHGIHGKNIMADDYLTRRLGLTWHLQ